MTSKEKADAFATYYAEKCSLENDFESDADVPEVRARGCNTLSVVKFRVATVRRELRRINTSKATGPDEIPGRVLKECANVLALPLAELFSLSFRKGVQPNMWKVASVVPIYKKGSKSVVENYRPVSLLAIASTVMESIINKQLQKHLESNEILSRFQFGFRSKQGTQDLLSILAAKWAKTMDSGGVTRVLAVDIMGAFDKVSHRGILKKAEAYGISGRLLVWLHSYLENRAIKVVVGGSSSEVSAITAGVPQGSVLGPVLFLIYINDLEEVLAPGIDMTVFADDTTLHIEVQNQNEAEQKSAEMQSAVELMGKWGTAWKITFEPTKSQAMVISRKHKPWDLLPIKFGGVKVKEVTEMKLLGVVFDKSLTFGPQIDQMAKRGSQRIGFLRKASKFLGKEGCKTAYKSFVRPTIEYAHLAWSGAAQTHLKKLDRVQARAEKMARSDCGLETLEHKRRVVGLCCLHKLHWESTPDELKNIRPRPKTEGPTRFTRSRLYEGHDFLLQSDVRPRSMECYRRSFPHAYIETWNAIPIHAMGKDLCQIYVNSQCW